jgi:hypothetical protein
MVRCEGSPFYNAWVRCLFKIAPVGIRRLEDSSHAALGGGATSVDPDTFLTALYITVDNVPSIPSAPGEASWSVSLAQPERWRVRLGVLKPRAQTDVLARYVALLPPTLERLCHFTGHDSLWG